MTYCRTCLSMLILFLLTSCEPPATPYEVGTSTFSKVQSSSHTWYDQKMDVDFMIYVSSRVPPHIAATLSFRNRRSSTISYDPSQFNFLVDSGVYPQRSLYVNGRSKNITKQISISSGQEVTLYIVGWDDERKVMPESLTLGVGCLVDSLSHDSICIGTIDLKKGKKDGRE